MHDDSRPNILLITSDQQLWNSLGIKNPHIKTPNLDRLARGGTDFTRAYCPNPTCTPTRASLLTGQYPSTHGAWSIGVKLREDAPLVTDVFREHGYDTTLIGKAHFQPLADTPGNGGGSVESQPTIRDLEFWRTFNETHTPWYGFDHVETCRNHADESHVGGHYALWMQEKGLVNWTDYYQPWPPPKDFDGQEYWKMGRQGAWDLPEELHYTTWTAERSIAAIERSTETGKPFYLWSSFHDPHPPYLVPEPWASMYDPADMPIGKTTPGEHNMMPPPHQWTQQPGGDWDTLIDPDGKANHGCQQHHYDEKQLRIDMAIYYGMISFMDHQIGRILDSLDEQGIADNTLIVFTTDHGHYIGHHGLVAKGPFHYEEGIRLPMIVRYPGNVPAGTSSDALQSLVDLPGTFLHACGIEQPGFMQGVNQLPVWRGDAGSIRDGLIVEMRHQPTRLNVRSFVTDRYKLTLWKDHPDWGELFDLQDDPSEINNRFTDPDYQSVRANLMQRWLDYEMCREATTMPRVSGA